MGPDGEPIAFHGVTTVLGGNPEFALAPAGDDHAGYLMRMMARVEGMPLDARHHPHEVPWSSPAGASVNPQFPPMAVVTPWSGDGLAVGSHESWAS